jgi:hypothetical protein
MMVNDGFHSNLVGGLNPSPLLKIGSWDDFSIPNLYRKSESSHVPVTTNQIFSWMLTI